MMEGSYIFFIPIKFFLLSLHVFTLKIAGKVFCLRTSLIYSDASCKAISASCNGMLITS